MWRALIPVIVVLGLFMPKSALADRFDCGAIRGTDYQSDSERSWFLANCVSSGASSACEVAPYIDQLNPRQFTSVYVSGILFCGDNPVEADAMVATFHYRTTDSDCIGRPFWYEGTWQIFSCTRFISGATAGYFVRVDICMRRLSQWYCAVTADDGAWLGFTPR